MRTPFENTLTWRSTCRNLFSVICDNVRQLFPAHSTRSLVVVTKHAHLDFAQKCKTFQSVLSALIFYKSGGEEEVTLIFKGYFFCPLSFHSTRQKSKASLLALRREALFETATSLGALRGFQTLSGFKSRSYLWTRRNVATGSCF